MRVCKQPVVVSIASCAHERTEAVAFIEAEMRRHFGCEPPPTSGMIFVARIDGVIAGTAVVEYSSDELPFSLEGRYAFDFKEAPYPCTRPDVLQGSRWIANKPGVSHRLVRELAFVASGFGRKYLFVEAKPYSVKRMVELGIVCRSFEKATLSLEKTRAMVGEDGMRYFIESPPPALYMMEFAQILDALSSE